MFARYLSVVVLVMVVGACSRSAAGLTDAKLRDYANQFVPQDAFDREEPSGIPWVQIAFNVRRDPLEFAISTERLERARADGWLLCRPQTPDWTGYEDMSQSPSRYTQHRKYLLHKDGVQIMVIGMYHSASEREAVRPREGLTDKPVQQVYLVVRNSTDAEAKAEAAEQGLSCD